MELGSEREREETKGTLMEAFLRRVEVRED